jgi:hypothetical protein
LIWEHQEECTDLKTLTIELFEGLQRSKILTKPLPKPAKMIHPEWWSELSDVKQLFDRVLMSSMQLSRLASRKVAGVSLARKTLMWRSLGQVVLSSERKKADANQQG